MSDYGRHFEFLQSPIPQARLGRYITGDTAILQAAPVHVTSGPDDDRRLVVELCTGATTPVKTRHGIVIWEAVYEGMVGYDPATTRWSDLDMIPAGKPVQLVSGRDVRVGYRNYDAGDFLGTVPYDGRVMVAGVAIATPTVVAGDYLTPGTGNDSAGYWAETSDATKAWLVVTEVINDVGVVQAQFVF